jgi:hypothetical protein
VMSHLEILEYFEELEAHGSAVGWGTALQVGKSRGFDSLSCNWNLSLT